MSTSHHPSASDGISTVQRARTLRASIAGASLEFYDFFIYGTAASIVFSESFFPHQDPVSGLLLALGTYALGYANRPLGAMLFGHIGDRVGRKSAFVGALLTMGLSTFAVGLLPTYQTIGVWGAVILTVLRFCQGIGLGGAWGGAAVLVAEAYPAKRRGFYGSLVQLSSPIGLLAGSIIFTALTAWMAPSAFSAWGWRIPFLLSAVLIFLGIRTHKVVEETEVFSELKEEHEQVHAPLTTIFRKHWRELLIAVGSRFGSDATFYIFGLFVLVYAPSFLHVSSSVALGAVIAGGVAQLIGIPLFGLASDRFGRRPVLIFGAIGCILWSIPFFPLLGTKAAVLVILASFVGLFLHAALWAPMAAFLSELFPTEVRYSGAAVGFQLAAVVGGAIAPLIATGLVSEFRSGLPVTIYVVVILLIAILAVAKVRETKGTEMEPDPRNQREATTPASSDAVNGSAN